MPFPFSPSLPKKKEEPNAPYSAIIAARCRPHRRGRGGRAPCERCQGAAGKRHRCRRAERDGGDEKRRHDLSSRQRRRLRHRAERTADGLFAPRDEQAAHGGRPCRHRHARLSRRGARGDFFRFPARYFLARARRAQRREASLRGRRPRHGSRHRGCPEGTSSHRCATFSTIRPRASSS